MLMFKVYENGNKIDKLLLKRVSKKNFNILDRNFKYLAIKKKLALDMYFASLFFKTLRTSKCYSNLVVENFYRICTTNTETNLILIRIQLVNPQKHIIDYRWNEIVSNMINLKKELDNALAWLSTLGGGYSSLGDHDKFYALSAGRISIQQMKIALKLGNPEIVSRCMLYFSLSLIQRGYLKQARDILIREYKIIKKSAVSDTRLKNMCLGIWSKLQYHWRLRYITRNI